MVGGPSSRSLPRQPPRVSVNVNNPTNIDVTKTTDLDGPVHSYSDTTEPLDDEEGGPNRNCGDRPLRIEARIESITLTNNQLRNDNHQLIEPDDTDDNEATDDDLDDLTTLATVTHAAEQCGATEVRDTLQPQSPSCDEMIGSNDVLIAYNDYLPDHHCPSNPGCGELLPSPLNNHTTH